MAVLAGVGLGLVWANSWRLLKRAAGGVAELEQRINRLAGENLLGWESRLMTERGERTPTTPPRPPTAA